ncbi:hypothetical protein VTJ04DRAFT_1246 [Mycothermus thermophilus]|uniref:uncharacterized protein n=1 Tax=Humicola insolens TaxID=85995 RepID=UPI003744A4DF
MDIDRFNFWQTLPVVVEAISLADYVAFDLEMTGISSPMSRLRDHSEKAAYRQAIEAARTFQVLEFGLTCLTWDYQNEEYRSRTFTFHLTPEFVPPNPALSRVFDRQLVFSPESLQFLRDHNFEFAFRYVIEALVGTPFASSIPPELLLPPGFRDPAPELGARSHNYHHITESRALTRIASAYKEVPPAIQAIKTHQALLYAEHRLALRRRSLDQIMCASPADTPIEPSAMGRQLRDGGPILVGHNVFHDLCFLHETFLADNNEGPVNKTLNDIDPGSLRRNLHHLFPRVLDTKGPGEKAMVKAISKATRLQTLYESLLRAHSGVEEDTVVIGEGHFPVRVVPEPGFDPRKPGSAGAHHAGYDSWMTAVVLVATERELALARRGDAGMSKEQQQYRLRDYSKRRRLEHEEQQHHYPGQERRVGRGSGSV